MAEQGKSGKSVKCVRAVRDAKLERYRLPNDGREWKHAARNRQALTNYLATFAFGDGTSIYPSVKTMAEHFGAGRATIFRWLDDLRSLNLLNKKSGLQGERGTAIRSLNMGTFVVAALAVQASFSKAGVANSNEQESQTQEQESQTQEQESHLGRDTTARFTVQPNRPPTAQEKTVAEKSSLEEQQPEQAEELVRKYPTVAFGKAHELDAQIQQHGFAVVSNALRRCAAEDYGGVKNIPAVVFAPKGRLAPKIAEEKVKQAQADQKQRNEKAQAVSVQKQIEENKKRWESAPAGVVVEEDPADFFREEAVTVPCQGRETTK